MASEASPLRVYHSSLKDEETEGPITNSTTRAALYNYCSDISGADNQLLRNLVGISEPALRCTLSLDGSDSLPPSTAKSEYGYDLYIAYNKLVSTLDIFLNSR